MLRVGIIGCGKNGHGHFQNLRRIKEARVCALSDVVRESAERWLSELDPGEARPAVVTDLDEMWDLVDAVWVCSPPAFHYEQVMAALRAGKHVLCEKPLALGLPHADEMAATARERGLKLMVGYSLRFMPAFSHYRKIVQSGAIGDLVEIWCTRTSSAGNFAGTWRSDAAIGGGMLLETFTHNIDWMRFVGGDVSRVFMSERTVDPALNFEDHAVGILEFESGATGHFYSSWSSGLRRYEWGAAGTEAVAVPHDEQHIALCFRGGGTELIRIEQAKGGFEQDRHFVEAVLHGRALRYSADDAVKTLEVHMALKLSARRRAPVSLPLESRAHHISDFIAG